MIGNRLNGLSFSFKGINWATYYLELIHKNALLGNDFQNLMVRLNDLLRRTPDYDVDATQECRHLLDYFQKNI